MRDDDFQLVDEFLAGDQEAFETLIRKYQKEIYYFVLRIVGNEEDAKDIAQMSFVNAFRSLARFKKESKFKTWLYKIALNLCRNHLKKSRAQQTEELDPSLAVEDDPAKSVIEDEKRVQLRKAVEELPEKQRLTVILRTYKDLSYADVSRILGCSEGAAKANFHFALQKLKKKLGKLYGLQKS